MATDEDIMEMYVKAWDEQGVIVDPETDGENGGKEKQAVLKAARYAELKERERIHGLIGQHGECRTHHSIDGKPSTCLDMVFNDTHFESKDPLWLFAPEVNNQLSKMISEIEDMPANIISTWRQTTLMEARNRIIDGVCNTLTEPPKVLEEQQVRKAMRKWLIPENNDADAEWLRERINEELGL